MVDSNFTGNISQAAEPEQDKRQRAGRKVSLDAVGPSGRVNPVPDIAASRLGVPGPRARLIPAWANDPGTPAPLAHSVEG